VENTKINQHKSTCNQNSIQDGGKGKQKFGICTSFNLGAQTNSHDGNNTNSLSLVAYRSQKKKKKKKETIHMRRTSRNHDDELERRLKKMSYKKHEG